MTAVIAVDYLKTVFLLWMRPNCYRLISAGSFDVADELGKNLFTHSIRIVRMSDELFDRYFLNLIFHNYPSNIFSPVIYCGVFVRDSPCVLNFGLNHI